LRRSFCLTRKPSGGCSTRSAARASAFCSRRAGRAARRRPRHLSLRSLVQHRGGAGRDRSGVGPSASLCAGYLPRPTRPASARAVSDRTGQRDSAARSASAVAEFGTNTGRPRRCAGSTPCWCARPVRTSGINGLALTKLDILDGFDKHRGLHRLHAGRQGNRSSSGGEGAQARVVPVYETIEGWKERLQCPLLGGFTGAGPSNMSAGGRTGGLPNRLAFHHPEREDTILVQNRLRLNGMLRKARNVE